MTSLNSKIQLAMLNRKKGRNLIEKGFTLVELMIVIVIVGILSSVALPSFLNQRNKAEATEAVTQISTLLKEAGMMNMEGVSSADIVTAINGSLPEDNDANLKFTYNAAADAAGELLCISAEHKQMADGDTPARFVNGTIAISDLSSGAATQKPNVSSALSPTNKSVADDCA